MPAPSLPPLVTPHQLAERLPDTGLRLVDLSSPDAYAAGHIDAAVRLDPVVLNRQQPPSAGLLPDLAMARRLFADLDLRAGQQVVAIDAGRSTEAARLAWVLEAYSVEAVAWLAGGMDAWNAEGLPVRTGSGAGRARAGVADPEAVAPVLSGQNLIAPDELLAVLDDPDLRILDVRGAAEFEGRDVRSAMGGHVPGAIHYEWTRQFDENGRLRDAGALRADLSALGIEPRHRVVVYCQSHQRSAVTWRVLGGLGFTRVQGLDGAWSAWGNRPDLPKASEAGPG